MKLIIAVLQHEDEDASGPGVGRSQHRLHAYRLQRRFLARQQCHDDDRRDG